ncbi:MAG: hypothetical protein P0Y53_22180 [Candidatus Pseudobacter hemicellulosilyticus]|uniref:WD40 repeat protein n=1 Tax=Candidatus Pseudobacter hemicellulosilyticus TaxID=3121375 RepID=A0AAJ5WT68_9BACT|nr:MAG: hypothetical protein P0Y53_22180 [Pseudobacter sp.]
MSSSTGFALLGAAILVAACSDAASGGPSSQPISSPVADTAKKPAAPIDPARLQFVKLTEPQEKSYSIELPTGWTNDVSLVRVYNMVRPVSTSVSPDGNTLFFFGDGRVPGYMVPNGVIDENSFLVSQNPLMRVGNYIPADQFFQQYIKEKFGSKPGFKIIGRDRSPVYEKIIMDVLTRSGFQPSITSVYYSFQYMENNKTTYGVLHGATIFGGTIWVPEVMGALSSGDPARFNETLLKIAATNKTDPTWKARENAQHQQRMAQLQRDYQQQQVNFSAMNQQHQLRMNQIQQSASAHQERMGNLQAANDARNNAWAIQQASLDRSHERFINVIRGEHTVADAQGNTFQVDNSHQKYFVNKTKHTYIGTHNTTSLDDLRKLGLNPDDYAETKVIR